MADDKNIEVILTAKQELFCICIVEGYSRKDAYIKAYDADGSNLNTIYSEASKLMKNPKIAHRIKELREQLFEDNKATIEEVLMIAAGILRADIADAYDENGVMKKLHEMPKHLRMAISGLDTDEIFDGAGEDRTIIGESKKLKLIDKSNMIEKFMKHLGAYEKDNKQKQTDNIVIFELPDNKR